MTTKSAALHKWLGSHGIPAYPSSSVPEDSEMPYLTYEPYFGAWGDGETSITVSAWFRTESEATANKFVDRLSKATMSGITLSCESGIVWIKRGIPFAYAVQDDDNTIKRRNINLTIEYMTIY